MKRRRDTREAQMIRSARLQMGYTQQEVATLIGVHIKAYQRLEYGERDIRKMPMDLGLKMCYLLELNPFELVLGEDAGK